MTASLFELLMADDEAKNQVAYDAPDAHFALLAHRDGIRAFVARCDALLAARDGIAYLSYIDGGTGATLGDGTTVRLTPAVAEARTERPIPITGFPESGSSDPNAGQWPTFSI